MKKTLLLITFVFGVSYSAFATPCMSDTLADYVTDGSCTFDGLTFSGFIYTASGSNPVPDGSINVTPVDEGGEIGLQFSAIGAGPAVGSGPDLTATSVIQFAATVDSATCPGCAIDDLVLTQAGASAGPGGYVNVTETSSVLPGSLVVGASPTVTILSDSATFSPTNTVSVTKSIMIDGGTSAGLGSQDGLVTNLFSLTTSPVPEPSLLILFTGLLALIPFARRKFVH